MYVGNMGPVWDVRGERLKDYLSSRTKGYMSIANPSLHPFRTVSHELFFLDNRSVSKEARFSDDVARRPDSGKSGDGGERWGT